MHTSLELKFEENKHEECKNASVGVILRKNKQTHMQ